MREGRPATASMGLARTPSAAARCISRSLQKPSLHYWKKLAGVRRLYHGSPAECVGPQGSVEIYPEGTGTPPENHWLRMSHPWVHFATPRDQCPTEVFGTDQRCDGKRKSLAF